MAVQEQQFLEVFAGRTDVYAKGYRDLASGKVRYFLVKEPLTAEVVAAHFAGRMLVGQYQLSEESTVNWFSLDFDEGDSPEAVLAEAVTQLEIFEKAGLQVYLERSRSGGGYHVWGFLDRPMSAEIVRKALKPLVPKVESLDRLYPVQVAVTPTKPHGNLLALPYYGMLGRGPFDLGEGVGGDCGVFVDPESGESIPLDSFMANLRYNSAEVIEELAERAPAERPKSSRALPMWEAVAEGETNTAGRPDQPLRGVLKLISPYGCRFMHHAFKNRRTLPEPQWYAALQQLTCFEQGREAAHMLSRDYPGYSPEETDAKYDQALRHPPVGCAYIHEHFTEFACDGCPMKAPYHKSQLSLADLVGDSEEVLERSDYSTSVDQAERRMRGEEEPGVPYGIEELDQFTRIRAGDFIVIGAMPSIGKTAFAIDIAVRVAEQGVPVMFFSAETGQMALETRFLARMSRIDSRAIRGERVLNKKVVPLSKKEHAALKAAADELKKLPIYMNYTVSDQDQMLALIEQVVLTEGIHYGKPMLIIYDYLQYGSLQAIEKGLSEYLQVSLASIRFKQLNKVLNHAVMALSQVKRDAEGDDSPKISWFKNSGRVEIDADTALILTGERVPGRIAKRKLTGVKQREGEVGFNVDLLMQQDICLFEGLPSIGTEAPQETGLFEDVESGF
jgi:hypothetical protein